MKKREQKSCTLAASCPFRKSASLIISISHAGITSPCTDSLASLNGIPSVSVGQLNSSPNFSQNFSWRFGEWMSMLSDYLIISFTFGFCGPLSLINQWKLRPSALDTIFYNSLYPTSLEVIHQAVGRGKICRYRIRELNSMISIDSKVLHGRYRWM